jgi:hypothetical protein
MRSPRTLGLVASAAVLATAGLAPLALAAGPEDVLPTRATAPVVLTGLQLPTWSRLAATGTPNPYPSGALQDERSAHNGRIVVPEDARTGVDPNKVVAYKWDGHQFVEVPVQVDQRFPYFLANPNSDFGVYSGTDTELTYQWDVESWKKTAGQCETAYPPNEGPTIDPVPTLDDDDEIVVMASDTGAQAPAGELGPVGTEAGTRQEVAVLDPLNQQSTYVYLFLKDGGSKARGYVHYERDADADQWIDRTFFADDDPEKLGSSNTGYGPNLEGTVCHPTKGVQKSTDRFPRDGVTVSTASYKWYASGRWMVRGMQVAKPGLPGVYGPDLIDRWKGRAFQSSPDSTISVVGFEDEQVNWEANSALLGERVGPVRAIREIWGADSGTNVTKTETFYRDAVTYRYRLRVHPIPSDGLYTSWDYNAGVASKYYNALQTEGVDIDGKDDEAYGNIAEIGGQPAFFDAPDATFDVPVALLKWEQVSGAGDNGSLVYVLENKGPTTLANPTVVPFYYDNACFDDGTGDDPVPRPWPGEASTDPRVVAAYGSADCTKNEKQGAFGEHGIHYFATWDTDNLFVGSPVPVNETDAQQWQFAVPTDVPKAVGEPFAQEVRVPLVAAAVEQPNEPATTTTSTSTTSTTSTSTTTSTTSTTAAPAASDDADGEPETRVESESATRESGYWMLDADGVVYPFGDARELGSSVRPQSTPAVDLEPTPTNEGYWIVDTSGLVTGHGDAVVHGRARDLRAGETVTSISATPSGRGYWLFTSLGRVQAFGDAVHYGDLSGTKLNGPVLDSIPTPTGKGYYLVASDGGVFTFGDAVFRGSMGSTPLNQPVQSLVPDGDGVGYWLVASDGGIFTFDAGFYGSMGDQRLNRPVTGMVASTTGLGYLMVAEDGGIFTFGDVAFHGSLGSNPPAAGVTSVAAVR